MQLNTSSDEIDFQNFKVSEFIFLGQRKFCYFCIINYNQFLIFNFSQKEADVQPTFELVG